jgi:hypothetical protein
MKTGGDSGVASKITNPIMRFMIGRMLGKFARLVESSPRTADK